MSLGIELLSTPNPDALDSCPIPHPKHVLPEKHLPGWHRLPIGQKIPAKSDPLDPVVFTRPKLGKSLHYTFPKKDFDTSYVMDLPLDYDPLHDPHLYGHLKVNSRNYFHLVKNGWILPYKDEVICSQKQFNQYREYARRLMVKEELIRRKKDEKETRNRIEKKLLKQVNEIKIENKAWKWLMEKVKANNTHLTVGKPEDDEDDTESLYREGERRQMLITLKTDREKRRIIRSEAKKLIDFQTRVFEKSTAWQRMEAEENERMDKIDLAKKRYIKQFQLRAKRRDKHLSGNAGPRKDSVTFLEKIEKKVNEIMQEVNEEFIEKLGEDTTEEIAGHEEETTKEIEEETAKEAEKESATGIKEESAKEIEKETAKGIEKESAEGIEKETAKGIETESAEEIEKESPEGVEKESAEGIEEKTAKGIEEETAKGIEEDSEEGIEEETTSQIKEEANNELEEQDLNEKMDNKEVTNQEQSDDKREK